MKVKLTRKPTKPTYCEGALTIDGKAFCDTLEDKDRGATQIMPFTYTNGNIGYWTTPEGGKIHKVYGETAIPKGKYTLTTMWWAKHECYVVGVLRVGGFLGILMHNGMTAAHSEGCVLLGKKVVAGRLDGSRLYMDALVARIMACEKKGEEVTLEVV
jgi:hypothetical protein